MRLVAVCLAIAVGGLVVPFLLTDFPPVIDYPNHFARIWLIAGGAPRPPMDAVYVVDWSRAWTNIGIDVAAGALAPFLSASTFAPGLLFLSLVLPTIGAIALARAASGRYHVLMLALPIVAWNFTFVLGFMNQQIAVGLALLAASLEPQMSGLPSWRRFGIRVLLAVPVYVVHVFGVGVYLIVAMGMIVGNSSDSLRRLPAAAVASMPIAGVAVALARLSPVSPGHEAAAVSLGLQMWLDPWSKFWTFFGSLVTYYPLVESLLALALSGLVVFLILFRKVEVHRGLLISSGLVFLVATVGPRNLGDATVFDIRLACVAWLVLLASLSPVNADAIARAWSWLALGLTAAALGRTASVAQAWVEAQPDIAAVRDALAEVPAGARILPVAEVIPSEMLPRQPWRVAGLHPSHAHYHLYAIPWRRAFVPQLFSGAGKQPIRVLPPYDRIAVPDGSPPPPEILVSPPPVLPPPWRYLTDWRQDFDFVLLINPQRGQALPDGLALVRDAGFAQLWRIVSPAD